MASQKSMRSYFWEQIWFSPLFALILGFGIFVPLVLALDPLIPGKEQRSISSLLWITLFASLAMGVFIGREFFRRGIGFKCLCGEFYAHNTPWVCGYCHEVNTPDHTQKLYNHLFRHCIKCHSIPLGLWCVGCNKVIQLTKWAVDMTRYARVHGPAPVEHPEITQLRHQQEIARIKRQYQEELEREQRAARGKQFSSDMDILAEKISTTKQFELDALRMVQKLKDAGTLDLEEEAMLKELIKDKVLEEFHVARRGGRQRPFA